MYEKCYNDRPLFVSSDKENNILEFQNTLEHLFFYLKQFGRHAYVIEPIELREKLKDFFNKAANLYNQTE